MLYGKYTVAENGDTMEKIEQNIKSVEIALGNPNLYTDDPQKFDELTAQLAADKQKLDELENQWLELQIKADALNG